MTSTKGRLEIPKPLAEQAGGLDDRFHAAKGVRTFMRKVFPDHWTFLLGEIALYSFIILILTGIFLTLFFQPSMTQVVYHGSYTKLNGVRMSQAYESTLNLSFDVRGGLLMRQIHHWAADVFLAAILCHLLRIFFTGAYRKPRDTNWLIGIGMFTLGIFEGFLGYSMPDDLLSGTGVRIAEGVLLGIPVVGTYLSFFLFGGQFPGAEFVPRFYIIHVLLIPGLLLGLVSAHLFLMVHQKHTQMPGKGHTEKNVVGQPAYPYFAVKTGAFFFFVFGVLALMGTFAQINPVWQPGPYTPTAISAGSQPDFYMGFLEGSLRMFPSWTWDIGGHTVAWNVLIPALVVPGIIFTVLGIWPMLERWATGDKGYHNVNQRPRNAPTRTGVGMAGVVALRRPVAGGRERPDRRAPADSAVHHDRDRPVRGVHRPGGGVLGHPADLHRAAAAGRVDAHARHRDRHHRAAAQRRIRGAGTARDRGGSGPADRAPAGVGHAAPPATSTRTGCPLRPAAECVGQLQARAHDVFVEGISLAPPTNGHTNGHGNGNGPTTATARSRAASGPRSAQARPSRPTTQTE